MLQDMAHSAFQAADLFQDLDTLDITPKPAISSANPANIQLLDSSIRSEREKAKKEEAPIT